jgi:hypothetical protein
MDNLLYYWSYCYSCCSSSSTDNEYERLAYETGHDKDDTSWVVAMFDSSVEDDEDDDAMDDYRIGTEPYIDAEDSVEDEEYYRQYIPNVHLIGDSETFKSIRTKESLQEAIKHVQNARDAMSRHYDEMTPQLYSDILICYVLAVEYCPAKYKRPLVKEYEHFKQIYASLASQHSTERADMFAQAYWKEAHSLSNTLTRRLTFYRLAIMCLDDPSSKRLWKGEYNKFFKAQRDTDTAKI